MNDFSNRNLKVKELLNKIGNGFCLAKWTQTTIHLGLGHTHSCHHPRTHVIPIEEIKKNPSALHNTEYKKLLRKEMLEGGRPTECNYCWNIEDLNNEKDFSDRVLKSAEDWSLPHYEEIVNSPVDKDFSPTYVEISFSNVCNFKCGYCMPSVSSQWMEEVEKYGGYPTSTLYNNLDWVKKQNKMPILHREENPYVEAFWKWWPDLYKEVQHFRITGGEPLLDKNTFKLLDYVIENPNPSLRLSINSNLFVPEQLYNKFIEKIKIIEKNQCVKEFTLYTSCEAYGNAAEYIRFGLSYSKWKNNFLKYITEVPRSKITNMATYNCMSVSSFKKFLEDILNFKQFGYLLNRDKNNFKNISLDIPYLNNPPHLNTKILDKSFLKYIDDQIDFMRINKSDSNKLPWGFEELEIHKMERIKTLFQEKLNSIETTQDMINRKDFALFVDEHDKRRGTNFLETFPEMTDFYNLCKSYR
jgi:organic radical activating enzyme